MPYIVTNGWYPTHLVQEVADAYMGMLKELPFDRSLGKETIPVAVSSGKNGVRVMSVMEVKEGKLQEANTWVGQRMRHFQSIAGYEYKVRIWATVVEALESIDRSMPGQ
jgi:hypothetical protein